MPESTPFISHPINVYPFFEGFEIENVLLSTLYEEGALSPGVPPPKSYDIEYSIGSQ